MKYSREIRSAMVLAAAVAAPGCVFFSDNGESDCGNPFALSGSAVCAEPSSVPSEGTAGSESLAEDAMAPGSEPSGEPSSQPSDEPSPEPSEAALFSPASISIGGSGAYSFGARALSSATSATFTLTNSGETAATSLAPSSLSSPFALESGSCGSSLAGSGGTCTVVVQYNPTSDGTHAATLNIGYHDGANSQAVTRAISGATAASLTISDGATYAFGTQTTGTTTNKSFTLTNSGGTAAASVAAGALSAPFAWTGGTFPGGGTCGSSLGAGSTCTMSVSFSPSSAGAAADTISLSYSDGADSQSATRAMSGTGQLPAPTISSVSPSSGTFAGGTSLTIDGTNFVNGATASVGGSACGSTTFSSSTRLVCTTPLSHTTGSAVAVAVQNPDTQSVTSSGAFTYTETAFGNGKDGSPSTLTSSIADFSADTTVQSGRKLSFQAKVTDIDTTNATLLTLTGFTLSSEYAVNDEVMWYVVGATNGTSCGGSLVAGNYGFSRLSAVDTSAGTVTLRSAVTGTPGTLRNSAISAATTGTDFCWITLVRVPNFTSLTVDSTSGTLNLYGANYDASQGFVGIIAFRVTGTLTLNGASTINFNVGGNGFTGGAGNNSTPGKGDSPTKTGVTAANGADTANNGAGGGAVPSVAGGGGGNVGAGGRGSPGGGGGLGGSALACGGGSCLFMGGGGGGGGAAKNGGGGGGLIFIAAKSIAGTTVDAQKAQLIASGGMGTNVVGGYGPGGGAGGTVYVKTQAGNGNLVFYAEGGDGADTVNGQGGGGGGGGKIYYYLCSGSNAVSSVAGGVGGTGAFSGDSGSNGSSSVTLNASQDHCSL